MVPILQKKKKDAHVPKRYIKMLAYHNLNSVYCQLVEIQVFLTFCLTRFCVFYIFYNEKIRKIYTAFFLLKAHKTPSTAMLALGTMNGIKFLTDPISYTSITDQGLPLALSLGLHECMLKARHQSSLAGGTHTP